MTRTATGIVLAALVLALAAPHALAQEGDVEYDISPTSGPPGTTITFTGSGCEPGGEGVFVLATHPEGNFPIQEQERFTADDNGNFEGTITVPDDVEPGEYPTGVDCEGGTAGWPQDFDYRPFTVTDEEAETEEHSEPTVPRAERVDTGAGGTATGSGITLLAMIALIAAAGAGVLRRSTTH